MSFIFHLVVGWFIGLCAAKIITYFHHKSVIKSLNKSLANTSEIQMLKRKMQEQRQRRNQ